MLFYAIMGTIVLALTGLVGGWIKGPNWSRTALIALFSALLFLSGATDKTLRLWDTLEKDPSPAP